MGDVILHVGENLSYDNEKILSKQAKELVSYEGDPLSVICAYNLKAEPSRQRMDCQTKNLSAARHR